MNDNATPSDSEPIPAPPAERPCPEAEPPLLPLDRRVIHYWRIHSAIGTVILLLAAGVAGLFAAWRAPLVIPLVAAGWLGLFLLRIWLLVWYPPKAYAAWGYRLNNRILETRQGVWFQTLTLLPLSRLQHVDLQCGPLERALGLASLTLFTAGTQHASIDLPGLDADEAARLRDQLVAVGGDDAV